MTPLLPACQRGEGDGACGGPAVEAISGGGGRDGQHTLDSSGRLRAAEKIEKGGLVGMPEGRHVGKIRGRLCRGRQGYGKSAEVWYAQGLEIQIYMNPWCLVHEFSDCRYI